jgi:UDPglucose--hexose-1-phosphate uridylyltransferase
MTKYVPDISSRRWVIVAPARTARPDDNHKKSSVCGFCEGHEDLTPDEVFRIGRGNRNERGWKVRVITNKYPITDFHEVVIHTPTDEGDLHELPTTHIGLIFQAYKQRYNFYRKNGQVLIFCNHGEHAGASINHPHSQIVVIPPQINLDSLTCEPLNNVVDTNKFFNVYCPDFSQWPYELWIAPKKTGTFFGDITDPEIDDLSQILHKVMKRLHKIYIQKKFAIPYGYNYYISPKENWYLRIIPRFVHRAGFELGTGLSVNIVDPIAAAEDFKK